MTAPNGIETSAVGRIVTLAMNQACSIASRHWNRRWMIDRHSWTMVSRHSAKKLPLCLSGAVKVAVVIAVRSLRVRGLGPRGALARSRLPAVRRRASESLRRRIGVTVLGRVDVVVGLLLGV